MQRSYPFLFGTLLAHMHGLPREKPLCDESRGAATTLDLRRVSAKERPDATSSLTRSPRSTLSALLNIRQPIPRHEHTCVAPEAAFFAFGSAQQGRLSRRQSNQILTDQALGPWLPVKRNSLCSTADKEALTYCIYFTSRRTNPCPCPHAHVPQLPRHADQRVKSAAARLP